MNWDHVKEINDKLIPIAKGIKILSSISWPLSAEYEFISSLEEGRVKLPTITYPKRDFNPEIKALDGLLKHWTAVHPVEVFLKKTIESYRDAARMLQAVGTQQFTKLSIEIFGTSSDIISQKKISNLQVAKRFLRHERRFDHPYLKETESTVSAETIAEFLRNQIAALFQDVGPKVEISSSLAAKATANAQVIRLREGTSYNTYDGQQLLVHEVLTHSLTALNGQRQKFLSILGFSAPRTVKTQEGLATYSEVITGSIDLRRLQRIALRIIAIENALNGASFVDTFRFFLENGQSPKESFWSAARIFRGGFPNKNIVFTKDIVYLDGLMKVHALFRWVFMNQRLDLLHLLFCGRLTIEDLFPLEESYKTGIIDPPKFLPGWYTNIYGLAGSLSFLEVSHEIDKLHLEQEFM
ncbi:MAG: DUF1704 domain-containing protein [Deltaproteobacteria bacterium]|nr:DUF1704 domain-containing protein [Deltaproteobacteria bacterium]